MRDAGFEGDLKAYLAHIGVLGFCCAASVSDDLRLRIFTTVAVMDLIKADPCEPVYLIERTLHAGWSPSVPHLSSLVSFVYACRWETL